MKKPIKICYLSSDIYPLFNSRCSATFGGAEIQMYLIGKAITQDSNFEVIFVTNDFGQNDLEIWDGVKIYKYETPPSANFIISKLPRSKMVIYNLFKKINADIYVQTTASSLTGIAALAAHLLGKKFIYITASDYDCDFSFARNNSWIEHQWYKYGIKTADFIIYDSITHQRLMQKNYHRPPEKIPWSIPATKYQILDVNKPEGEIILWIGRCMDYKRPEIFIDLATQFPHERFVMICPAGTDNNYNQKINQLANSVPNLKFIRYVPFNQIDNFYLKSKTIINTSTFEGFCNIFLEAAKNKTPNLSLKVNPDNFLHEYNCGFCADDNIQLLKQKLNLLLTDKQLRKTMGQNGFNYMKKFRDINNLIKKEKWIYKSLVS